MPEACDMPLYNVIIVSPGLTLTAEVRWKNGDRLNSPVFEDIGLTI